LLRAGAERLAEDGARGAWVLGVGTRPDDALGGRDDGARLADDGARDADDGAREDDARLADDGRPVLPADAPLPVRAGDPVEAFRGRAVVCDGTLPPRAWPVEVP